jgi:hypothetical protein
MYLETMERVLAGMSKTLLDTGGAGAGAAVPYIAVEPPPQPKAGAVK